MAVAFESKQLHLFPVYVLCFLLVVQEPSSQIQAIAAMTAVPCLPSAIMGS